MPSKDFEECNRVARAEVYGDGILESLVKQSRLLEKLGRSTYLTIPLGDRV